MLVIKDGRKVEVKSKVSSIVGPRTRKQEANITADLAMWVQKWTGYTCIIGINVDSYNVAGTDEEC